MSGLKFSKTGRPKMSTPTSPGTMSKAIVSKAIRGAGSAIHSGFTFVAKMDSIHVANARYERRVNRAYRILLYRFGASVRTTARRRMRQQTRRYWDRDKVWWNGQRYKSWKYSKERISPFSHKKMLKNSVSFAPDVARRNVVIGPLRHANNIAPLLEYGGMKSMLVNWKRSRTTGKLIISKKRSEMKKKTVRYAPRPYMRPAFHAVIDTTLPELLKKSQLPKYLKDVFYQRARTSQAGYNAGGYV